MERFIIVAKSQSHIAPIGSLLSYYGNKLPNGCLWCDGSMQQKVEYPELFGLLKNKYHINDLHFSIPNLDA